MTLKPIITLCLLLFSTINLMAFELKIHSDVLEESKLYSEDYLFAGSALKFTGETNDLYAFAEDKVDFTGNTKLAIFAASGELEIAGTVGNGVKGAGETINLKGDITGTSFLAAEIIAFMPGSVTNGTVFLGAKEIIVEGPVTGDFYAAAGEVTIQNEIKGDVNIYVGQLNITDQGKIDGDLIYHSDHEISEEEAARVTGNVTFKIEEEGLFSEDDSEDWPWFSLFLKISFAVMGFLMLLLPVTKALEKPLTEKAVSTYSLWGLLPIFIYPTTIVFSFVLVITIPLGIALILGVLPLMFVTKIIGITLIGGLISKRMNLTSNSRFLFFLIGVSLYTLLSFIPYFGLLLMIFVSAIGCGTFLSSLVQKEFA